MNQESEQDKDIRQGPDEDNGMHDGDQDLGLHAQVEMLKAELEQLQAQTLLEVFDSLEAGLASAAEDDPLRAGVELTLRQLGKVTATFGLTEVAPAPGDAFDPERHQAMSMSAVEGIPPGAVAQLFQKGYVLNERLLRPAMVVVAPS